MLDLSYLSSRGSNIQKFIGSYDITGTNRQESFIWDKPRGYTTCHIICIGGGGNGGTSSSGAGSKGGGGGGGSSSVTTLTIPLIFLPDVLYVYVGDGVGVGGLGLFGGLSYVSINSDFSNVLNLVSVSGIVNSVGSGARGDISAGGNGGTAGIAPTLANMVLGGFGVSRFYAGQAGTSGGGITGTAGTDIAIPTTGTVCMGGTGGGGSTASVQAAGGAITATANALVSEYRPSGAAAGVNGSGGLQLWKPLWGFGGLGGGSRTAGTAGTGGNGAYGCGGGGGGSNADAATPSLGGAGGPGIVIIQCW